MSKIKNGGLEQYGVKPLNSSNLEQLALKGLSGQKPVLCLEVVEVKHCMMKDPHVFVG